MYDKVLNHTQFLAPSRNVFLCNPQMGNATPLKELSQVSANAEGRPNEKTFNNRCHNDGSQYYADRGGLANE